MAHKKAYMILYEDLRRDITAGRYKPGDRLPSKRELSEARHVAVITVEHAYELLCDEGYAESRERSGFFCSYRPGNLLSSPDAAPALPPSVRKSTFSEQLPVSVFSKTMRNVISRYEDSLMIKSPNYGIRELRNAISSYLARSRGITVDPSRVIIGSGSEYFYSLIVIMLGRDRIYGIEDPSYENIRRVYQANGAAVELLRLDNTGIRTASLQKTKASVLHVTPFHSFPSGVTAPVSKRMEYISWAIENDSFIIEDDFDSEFTVLSKPEDTIFSLDSSGRIIYLNSFSRTVSSSLRAGYMLLPERLTEVFRSSAGFFSCSVPVFEQYFLTELLNSGEFERHINRIRRRRRQEQKQNCS